MLRKGIVWSSLFVILLGHSTRISAQTIKLDRIEVEIDFKEEGYYRSIPFIALARNLFFITDNFSHRVLEYRLQGNRLGFLRAIGRPGQGPGDLMRPTDISISDDILAVEDEFGISFFDLDGAFKSKFQLLSRAVAVLFNGKEIYTATYDAAKPDLIQVYSNKGEELRSFQDKKSLYPIRYEINKGLSPGQSERIIFDGLLRTEGQSVYFLSRRFGNVLRFNSMGEKTGSWNLSNILGKNEKAKEEENRRMFLEEGFDLEKHDRFIPNYFLFDDAQLLNGKLFLLLQNYDFKARKLKNIIEFVEINLDDFAIVGYFTANTRATYESAMRFLLIGDERNPAFLTTLRAPKEDEKICIFKPKRN